jgi:hypothetical protein
MPATTYSVVAAKNPVKPVFLGKNRISGRVNLIRYWLYHISLLYKTFANGSSPFHTAIGWLIRMPQPLLQSFGT